MEAGIFSLVKSGVVDNAVGDGLKSDSDFHGCTTNIAPI